MQVRQSTTQTATNIKVHLHPLSGFLAVCASFQPARGQSTAMPELEKQPCSIGDPLVEAVSSSFLLLQKVFLATSMFTLLF